MFTDKTKFLSLICMFLIQYLIHIDWKVVFIQKKTMMNPFITNHDLRVRYGPIGMPI